MEQTTTYSFQGTWLLANGKRVLNIEGASPEVMQLKVKQYQDEANKAAKFLGKCACGSQH